VSRRNLTVQLTTTSSTAPKSSPPNAEPRSADSSPQNLNGSPTPTNATRTPSAAPSERSAEPHPVAGGSGTATTSTNGDRPIDGSRVRRHQRSRLHPRRLRDSAPANRPSRARRPLAHRTDALSTQVLQEFYVVATRRFDPPVSRREARDLAASQLEERHTLSFWDALIVEAARRAGATRLVTEDLQTGRRLARILIDNPFASTS
jgi:hypothetical protein